MKVEQNSSFVIHHFSQNKKQKQEIVKQHKQEKPVSKMFFLQSIFVQKFFN